MTKPLPWSRRKVILDAAPDAPVKIYSLQHPEALAAAQKRGYLTGDPPWIDADDRRPYDWMCRQMGERLPGYTGDYPVWAWLKRPKDTKIDPEYGLAVRVTALVPRNRMLLSDYNAWHSVLHNDYLAFDREEWEANNEAQDAVLETSWTRMFDLTPKSGDAVIKWYGQPDTVQACVDRIYLSEIVDVLPIRPRGPGSKRGSKERKTVSS